ncbi:MAG: bifunctional metallophosphatase/5'-nucleotidase [Armatimonadota bacterium]
MALRCTRLGKYTARAVVAAVITVLSLATGCSSAEYKSITILHTNDTHGHLIPFSYTEPRTPNDETAALKHRTNIGGIARRATLINQIRETTHGNTFVVDAGDALDGTPFSVEYMGEADFAAMSTAGYQMRTNGNHEFSASLKEFIQNIKTGGFPVIDANVIDKKTSKPALPEYEIIEINGIKVAFFGLTTDASTYKAAKEGFTFVDPLQTAKQLVPVLRQQADLVIGITHIGYDQDIKLAQDVDGIDVIVGGHSHTRLAEPTFVSKDSSIQAFKVGGTVIVQNFQWGGELGRLDLRIRKDNGKATLMSYDGELIPVTSDIKDDPATAKTISKYYRPLAKYYDETIGEAQATFYNDFTEENSILNLICEALKEKTKTDASIYNTGGVRADIVKGPIKMWDVATVMPFRNNIMTLDMSGTRLKQALIELKPGVAGIRYKVENNKLVESSINGKPIDDNTTYTISTIDFLANFGLKDVTTRRDLGINYREAIKDYIKVRKTISPVQDGRRLVIGTQAPV